MKQAFIDKSAPVIVLGLYFPGIDLLKDFSRRGIPCEGADCSYNSPGLYLRRIKTHLCPDPEKSEAEWLNFLIGLGENHSRKPVLMITSDKYILPVLRNAEKLSGLFVFNTSENQATENLMNKKGLAEIAVKSNSPIARTIFYSDGPQFRQDSEKLNFPCLIRPAYGKKWLTEPLKSMLHGVKLIKADTRTEMDVWLEKILPYDRELMIQELIPGPDENLYYLVVYIDKSKRCLGYFCGQKIRITPIHFGSASYMKTVNPKPVLNEAIRLLTENGYWGPAGVEFKKDERTGEFKLVEINTRFGLWDVMGRKLGVNLFLQAYLDLTGQHPEPLIPQEKDLKWISLTRDIGTFGEYRKEKLITTFQWLKTYIGRVYFADLYWSEPKVMYQLYIRKIIRKFLR